jgi:murein DD-endopeptidase MepM/ murein hydrolase activator NlpD
MTSRLKHGIIAAVLAHAALFWAVRTAWPWLRPLRAPAITVTAAYDDWADTLRSNETVSRLLADAGIRGADQTGLLAAARRLDTRRLRSGLVFHFRRVRGDTLVRRVMVRPVAEHRVWFNRTGLGWAETVEEIPWITTRVRVSGQIATSLYDALDAAVADSVLPAAERVALAWEIADVYDWEVDFSRDLRPGDRFEVLIDRLESPAGERRFGRILAARVDVARRPSYAFYFESELGRGAFYDAAGRSLRRAFLRAPLEFRRISSGFGGRMHPVLRQWRSHQGVDYAAAAGTRVRATADGVVTKAGRDGGYGVLVELRHANGIRTRYGHLRAFAPGIRVGARVSQNETIGYVGSTGLSTGPHLHYEFLVNGRPTNPRRKDAGAVRSIPDALRDAFETQRVSLQAQLERSPTSLPFPLAPFQPDAASRDD